MTTHDNLAEAVKRALKKMRMGYISDDEMTRLEQALAAYKCTPPAPDEVGEAYWLIEAGGVYWCGRGAGDFKKEVHEAVRFGRQQDAERVIHWILPEDQRNLCRATEHVFLDEAATQRDAERISALKDPRKCPLGEDCDMTLAYMTGPSKGKEGSAGVGAFDFPRVLAWAKDPQRKPAVLSFTEGPEREAAYLVEAIAQIEGVG